MSSRQKRRQNEAKSQTTSYMSSSEEEAPAPKKVPQRRIRKNPWPEVSKAANALISLLEASGEKSEEFAAKRLREQMEKGWRKKALAIGAALIKYPQLLLSAYTVRVISYYHSEKEAAWRVELGTREECARGKEEDEQAAASQKEGKNPKTKAKKGEEAPQAPAPIWTDPAYGGWGSPWVSPDGQ